MKSYKIKTFIPTLSSYCYLEEFNNKNLIDINKYILSRDDEGLYNYVSSFIPEIVKSSLDKFFILCFLRMRCLGNDLKLISKNSEGTSLNLTLHIISMLELMLNNLNLTNLPEYIDGSTKITFRQPSKLYYANFLDLLEDILDHIISDNKSIYFKMLNQKDKKSIVKKIKMDFFLSLKKHIINNSNYINLSKIETVNSIKVNFYNNSSLKILKLLYTQNISNIYSKIYLSSQKINLDYNNFINMTPSETDLLISIYKTSNKIK